MSELLRLKTITLPLDCVKKVYQHLRNAGDDGLEGVALFAGVQNETCFDINEVIIPAQIAENIEDGLLYSVDGDELHKINVWLYNSKMTLLGQIHSHPGKAYHSETDDRFPIVTEFGALSIVVPNFAFDSFSLKNWAVYRLSTSKKWIQLPTKEVTNLILIK